MALSNTSGNSTEPHAVFQVSTCRSNEMRGLEKQNEGLKIPSLERDVRVRFPLRAPTNSSALDARSSADYHFVAGELRRSKKPVLIRGLNLNHNHDLKNIFKAAATTASSLPGPFRTFYENLLGKGLKPAMARLTFARKHRRHQFDPVEERRTFRSRTTEITSSLSAQDMRA